MPIFFHKLKTKHHNAGFTLLEIIITLFIITIGMGGAFTVIQKSFTMMSLSESRLIAANLAQEGVEIMRNIRDTNWLEGGDWDYELSAGDWEVQYDDTKAQFASPPIPPVAQCVAPCNYDDMKFLHIDNGFYKYLVPAVPDKRTKFKRKVTISDKTPDSMKITVDVIWKERGGTEYNFTVYHWLYDWK